MYCPNCEAEYVEGIAECGDCRVPLVAELPHFDDSDDKLRMVRVVDPTEGPMVEELLGNNGIDSFLQGEMSAAAIPAAGELTEVRVWVRGSDQPRATELIDAFFRGMQDIEDREGEEEA